MADPCAECPNRSHSGGPCIATHRVPPCAGAALRRVAELEGRIVAARRGWTPELEKELLCIAKRKAAK